MEINWFTFFAQILNFFMLIYLLQRVLYKPITQAMAVREKTIRDRLLDASQQKKVAHQQVKHYEKMQQQFTNQRAELLQKVKLEVEQTRQDLSTEMKASIAKERSQWQKALQRHQDTFLREISQRTLEQLQETVRRVLTDLAEVELETQMARIFLQKLGNLNTTEQEDLTRTLGASTKDSITLTLTSAFPISQDICDAIADTLQGYFDTVNSTKIELDYAIESSLLCGIELRGIGYKLAWSLDAYLDNLTEELTTIFAEELNPV